ncbi:MAG: signal transduction histidine kinase, LytS [Gemmatimonadetes bacterium]|nr:signal transduction histidine kinase, LytS [Gemmatimonadota bacterium]
MFSRMGGRPIPAWRAFAAEAPQWYGWALLTPVIIRLGERFPLQRPLRARNVTVHALASLGASALVAFGDALVNLWVRPGRLSLWQSAGSWFISGLPAMTVAYFAILGLSYAVNGAARLRERERKEAELEAQLRDAQLAALRMQLQPHFLFNSLNAVMALVRDQDTARAVRALALLSDVLRATINAGDAHETTLAQELDFVQRYLEIEHVRFGDRLRVTIDVPNHLAGARVPTFILQPFVENSLKHGVLRERAGNEISIHASVVGSALRLAVRDDGRGLPAAGMPPTGVGIENARARLAQMYGDGAALSVRNATDGPGVSVEITLPLASCPAS